MDKCPKFGVITQEKTSDTRTGEIIQVDRFQCVYEHVRNRQNGVSPNIHSLRIDIMLISSISKSNDRSFFSNGIFARFFLSGRWYDISATFVIILNEILARSRLCDWLFLWFSVAMKNTKHRDIITYSSIIQILFIQIHSNRYKNRKRWRAGIISFHQENSAYVNCHV